MKNIHTKLCRDLHFDLRYLGHTHETAPFTLRCGGRSYPMRRHTRATLTDKGVAPGPQRRAPTHYAEAVETDSDKVNLVQVLGPVDPATGVATLAALVISTQGGTVTYSATDVAQAVVFMNPSITVLTPSLATTVLGHIAGATQLQLLSSMIESKGAEWNTPRLVKGGPQYTYVLNQQILNVATSAGGQAKQVIYSDPSLQGSRWNLAEGVSCLDMNAPPVNALARRSRPTANTKGYSVNVEDGGPNYGFSLGELTLDDNFVLGFTISNSYIRHGSVFVEFQDADGKGMPVGDNIWTTIAKGATLAALRLWLPSLEKMPPGVRQLLTSSDNTLKWFGNVDPEETFLGVPVSAADGDFSFDLKALQSNVGMGPIGKIRVLVGSLGVASGNDWDPTAAWLGLAETVLLDLAVPTFALMTGVGEDSNEPTSSILSDPTFLLGTAYSLYEAGSDILSGSPAIGDDLFELGQTLVDDVLSNPEVIAKLGAVFGTKAIEDAIPIVGWAMWLLSMEGTVAQLSQTIGEVISSPRVVEFDIKVTMTAQITLTPDPAPPQGEFAQTAAGFTVTAQYSGNTTRTYAGAIENPDIASIPVTWEGIPVGGSVTFVVALYSKEGWLVGKGQSATVPNVVGKTGTLVVEIAVQQQLYPLTNQTTYRHAQLLSYQQGEGYCWQQTSDAPKETAFSLGSGPAGHVLQALNGITLSDDIGVVGYSWEASGLGIQPVNGKGSQTELYAMQNVGYKPIAAPSLGQYWPSASYMTSPEGYPPPPLLVYIRAAGSNGASPGLFFFLDPMGDSTNGYHLRQVAPVTDPAVPMKDRSRLFALKGPSWGRFPWLPTSLAIHSNGYVVGVNPAYNNMQILRLPSQSSSDADAPWACTPLGPGNGAGRLLAPTLAAIAPDQTILVLEGAKPGGNQRIQAFSRGGHPVKAFAGSYWINLNLPDPPPAVTAMTYLSMSVDVAGYIYVLSQNGNGYQADQFYLDIYTPAGSQLVHQQGLVAAGMAVDLWRNVYTLNFQAIHGVGGRTEPSLSQYIPRTPPTLAAPATKPNAKR